MTVTSFIWRTYYAIRIALTRVYSICGVSEVQYASRAIPAAVDLVKIKKIDQSGHLGFSQTFVDEGI